MKAHLSSRGYRLCLGAALVQICGLLACAIPTGPAAGKTQQTVKVGRFSLDLSAHRLLDPQGAEVALTSMEFDLLRVFVGHPNQVLSRDQLLNLTRNRDWEPFDRSIDIRIARLRRKLEPDPDKPQLIKTVRGAGYCYVPAR